MTLTDVVQQLFLNQENTETSPNGSLFNLLDIFGCQQPSEETNFKT